jgi:hypothetical protein
MSVRTIPAVRLAALVPGLTALVLGPAVARSGPVPQPPSSEQVASAFERLEGEWVGSGTLLGRAAAFEMRWERDASGFVRLSFSNAWVTEDGGVTPVLSARATYLVDGAAAVGVWIDDRPQQIRLDAVVSDSSVITHWVAPSEEGRTEYVVHSPDSVTVRDFVRADDGERLFAEASYRRATPSSAPSPTRRAIG